MSNLSSPAATPAFVDAVDAYHARFVFSDEAYINITSRTSSFNTQDSCSPSFANSITNIPSGSASIPCAPIDMDYSLDCSESQVSSSILAVTAPRKLVRDLAPGETLRLGYSEPSGLHFVRIPDQSARDRVDRACDKCRFRKTKCSGDKPVCHGCAGKRLECVYSLPRARRSSRRRSQQTAERDSPVPQMAFHSTPHPFASACELFLEQDLNLPSPIDAPPVLMLESEATSSIPPSLPTADANGDVDMFCAPVDFIDPSFDWSTVFTGLAEMGIVKDPFNTLCSETQSHENESAPAMLEWVHTSGPPSLNMDVSIFQEISDVFATSPNLDSPISAVSESLPATPSPQMENFPSFVDGGSDGMSPSMMFDFDYNGDEGILLYPSHFKDKDHSESLDMSYMQW